jgi:hypothetical protein
VQEGKLPHASFPRWWDDVVRDELVLVQEGNLVCASFPPLWDDVVCDELVLVQEVDFPHGGMMLFEMSACLCKRKI